MGYNDPVRTKKETRMPLIWTVVKTIIALTAIATLLIILLFAGILAAIF